MQVMCNTADYYKLYATNCAIRRAYAFTNENIRAYIDFLNILGGRVSTVGSSGEQAFYAIFKGALAVTVIDAFPYVKHVIELKKCAIENLSLKEFINYWDINNILYGGLYKQFNGLSDETCKFFSELRAQDMSIFDIINRYSFDKADIVYGKLKRVSFAEGVELYDNEKKYNKLKNKLKNAEIEYKLAEFKDFPKQLNGEYSSILISNIYDYYEDKGKFFAVTKELIDKNLSDGGTMQVYYKLLSGKSFFGRDLDICAPELRDGIKMHEFYDPSSNRPLKSSFNKHCNKRWFASPNEKTSEKDCVYIYEKE